MNQKMSFDEQEQLSRSLIAVNPHRNGNKGTITTMLLDDYKELTQKFFSLQTVADGAVSRLCLSTIIRPDFAPRPVVGEYDE